MAQRLFVSLFLWFVTHSICAAENVQLLRTGSFHGDEVAPGAAGEWFALALEETGGASLERVRVTISTEHDAILDDDDEETGKRVETSNGRDAAVLIRGLASLREGPVDTVAANLTLRPGVEHRLGAYTLNLTCTASTAAEYRCPLAVREDKDRQTIATYAAWSRENELTFGSEHEPVVLWAGDLDRDGRLDLLVDTSDHYNVSEVALYLSSIARNGELVRRAANFRTTGC